MVRDDERRAVIWILDIVVHVLLYNVVPTFYCYYYYGFGQNDRDHELPLHHARTYACGALHTY